MIKGMFMIPSMHILFDSFIGSHSEIDFSFTTSFDIHFSMPDVRSNLHVYDSILLVLIIDT